MAKASKATATEHVAVPGFEGHYTEADGYTIGFESYSMDQDPAALFKGLPNDHCQCPHWGVVLRGRVHFRYEDGSQDVIEAGEAYYVRPGHLPVLSAGTEVIEFSPSADLARTMEAVMKNLEAMGGSA
ncbi:MAG TPA: cupin domain-containing protein [Actinomycetota bacterium]|nr:cupin domain-containing protein [Actinomycetota bacterium]